MDKGIAGRMLEWKVLMPMSRDSRDKESAFLTSSTQPTAGSLLTISWKTKFSPIKGENRISSRATTQCWRSTSRLQEDCKLLGWKLWIKLPRPAGKPFNSANEYKESQRHPNAWPVYSGRIRTSSQKPCLLLNLSGSQIFFLSKRNHYMSPVDWRKMNNQCFSVIVFALLLFAFSGTWLVCCFSFCFVFQLTFNIMLD